MITGVRTCPAALTQQFTVIRLGESFIKEFIFFELFFMITFPCLSSILMSPLFTLKILSASSSKSFSSSVFLNISKWFSTLFSFVSLLLSVSRLPAILNGRSGCHFLKPFHLFSIDPPSLNLFSCPLLKSIAQTKPFIVLFWVERHGMPCKNVIL